MLEKNKQKNNVPAQAGETHLRFPGMKDTDREQSETLPPSAEMLGSVSKWQPWFDVPPDGPELWLEEITRLGVAVFIALLPKCGAVLLCLSS